MSASSPAGDAMTQPPTSPSPPGHSGAQLTPHASNHHSRALQSQQAVERQKGVFSPTRSVSPSGAGAAKEIRDRLRLLQRTISDSISPTYNVPSTRDLAEKRKLLSMMKTLEKADKKRGQGVEQHRTEVLEHFAELQTERHEKLTEQQLKKHAEHEKQHRLMLQEAAQMRREASQKWWGKHEVSKLKLHNDSVRDWKRAREQSCEREQKIRKILEKKEDDLHVREIRSEAKRRSAEERLKRIARTKRENEEQRDLERELRKIHWDKRLAAVDKERNLRRKRNESGRQEALQRNTDATAFEVAAGVCKTREKLREARLTELALRRKEEKAIREQKNRHRFERVEGHIQENTADMRKDYAEIARRHQESHRRLAWLKQCKEDECVERKKHNDEVQQTHASVCKSHQEQRMLDMEERWSRRSQRCYDYFTSAETESLVNVFVGN